MADLLSNIASEQRAKVVYEYLYRQIDDKYVRETIDFLLNREEAHNALFREALNKSKIRDQIVILVLLKILNFILIYQVLDLNIKHRIQLLHPLINLINKKSEPYGSPFSLFKC